MRKDELEQQIKRHQALKEYSKAFRMCLDSIKDSDLSETAFETGKNLVKQFGFQVMEDNGSRRELKTSLTLGLDWIIDIAISMGYKTLERGKISTGILSSVPAIVIGGFMAKQKFGIKQNKDNTSTLIYVSGTFSSDSKLVNRLCDDILEMTHNIL